MNLRYNPNNHLTRYKVCSDRPARSRALVGTVGSNWPRMGCSCGWRWSGCR